MSQIKGMGSVYIPINKLVNNLEMKHFLSAEIMCVGMSLSSDYLTEDVT